MFHLLSGRWQGKADIKTNGILCQGQTGHNYAAPVLSWCLNISKAVWNFYINPLLLWMVKNVNICTSFMLFNTGIVIYLTDNNFLLIFHTKHNLLLTNYILCSQRLKVKFWENSCCVAAKCLFQVQWMDGRQVGNDLWWS